MKIAILSGSVYGTAEEVARHAEQQLQQAGFETRYQPRGELAELIAWAPEALLVVTSTTGMGDLPDSLQKIHAALRDQPPAWYGLPGAVSGLGDSSYGDTFCGGGEQIRELMPSWASAKCCRCCAWTPARRSPRSWMPNPGWPSWPSPCAVEPLNKPGETRR